MEHITAVMQNADSALHLHQIVSKSKQPEHVVRAFIREQSAFGNIDVVPARGRYGNRYEWVGPVPIKEEMLALAKDVEAESVAEAQLGPTAEELDGLPEELLAELNLPNSVIAQPENVTIEPNQAINIPKTFTNEQKDMTKAENNTAIPEPQSNVHSISASPISPKIGYMITAAKGKMERRQTHEAAKRLAGRGANDGHKNVVIHLTSEYERARVKPEVQFQRA